MGKMGEKTTKISEILCHVLYYFARLEGGSLAFMKTPKTLAFWANCPDSRQNTVVISEKCQNKINVKEREGQRMIRFGETSSNRGQGTSEPNGHPAPTSPFLRSRACACHVNLAMNAIRIWSRTAPPHTISTYYLSKKRTDSVRSSTITTVGPSMLPPAVSTVSNKTFHSSGRFDHFLEPINFNFEPVSRRRKSVASRSALSWFI
jgi:hypothetical protein